MLSLYMYVRSASFKLHFGVLKIKSLDLTKKILHSIEGQRLNLKVLNSTIAFLGSSNAARGCFPGDMKVQLASGKHVPVSSLRPGTKILSFGSGGHVHEDVFLNFMHLDAVEPAGSKKIEYVSLITDDNEEIELTPNHLVYIQGDNSTASGCFDSHESVSSNPSQCTGFHLARAVFAGKVSPGNIAFLLKTPRPPSFTTRGLKQQLLYPKRIKSVKRTQSIKTAYAPLTLSGNILINGVAASCYATIESHTAAHVMLTPERYFHFMKYALFPDYYRTSINDTLSPSSENVTKINPSFYLSILHYIADTVLPSSLFWRAEFQP